MPDQDQYQRESAYFLWEKAGKPNGMDLEFWYAAQQRKLASDDQGGDDVSVRARPGTGHRQKKKRQKQ
jgi:hypothetical protein